VNVDPRPGALTAVAVPPRASTSWRTPVLDLRLAAGAPLLGAAIGLAAGTYPAWRASAIHPIDALRVA
jgi:putative ABC transport system permease protein